MKLSLTLLLIWIISIPILFGQINHKEDEEEFLKSIQLFIEANEIGEEMVEKLNNGEVPSTNEFVKKVTDGIQVSEKVSHSYLDSKHPDLIRLYYDFVNSYKQLLHIYDEVRDMDKAMEIQKDVSEKQYKFMAFMEKNQELFGNQIEVTQPEEKSNLKTMLWFLAKTFLAALPFIFALMLVSMVFNGIALVLNRINKKIVIVYLTLISIIYLYFYGFLGAYYREIFEYYSEIFKMKWLIFILCLLGILIIYQSIGKELNYARQKLNQNHPLGVFSLKMGNNFSTEDINLICTIHSFKGIWMIFASFFYSAFSQTG
jgi:hypothetical protein